MAANGNGLPLLDTCAFCEDSNTKKCIKCQKFYCILHSSRISSQLCQDCFKEVYVIIDKYTKITEDFDLETNERIEHGSSCGRIRMDGPDYVWHSVYIQQQTDPELSVSLEFHKHMVSLIEKVTDIRKVEGLTKLRGEKPPVLQRETKTRTKTTKSLKQQKSPRDILLATGIKESDPLFAMLLAQMEGATK